MAATMKAAREKVFGLMYQLKEGRTPQGIPRVWGLLALSIELLQVVRLHTILEYGWTFESQAMVRWFDLVAVATDQVRQWVPFLVLYIVACLLVVGMAGNAMYVVKITREGILGVLWPLKMLRFLVATVATTLFSTTLEWLIYPLYCAYDETSMSEWLHGDGSACNPWGVPDVVLSVISMLLVLVLVIIAFGVNLFSFELNPIVRGSRVLCTGRVEVLWTAFKIALGLLPFLSPLLSPLAVSLILSLFATLAFYEHLHRLPFQDRACNLWRGGVHATALWLCIASVVNSSLGHNYEGKQGVQWALLAIVPVMFLVGSAGVLLRERAVHRFLNILRAEYDASMMERDNNMSESEVDGASSVRRGGTAPKVQKVLGQDALSSSRNEFAAVQPPRRSAYEEFFDTAWKERRAFRSGSEALLSCRHLLFLREEDDLPFLNFVLGKAIAEHPESLELQLFQLAALRFIHCDAKQAHDQEKKLQDKKGMWIDRTFQLYAIVRRATAEVSSSLGQAVNLVEFDSKMTAARRSHQNCLSLIKKFFHLTLKKEKSGSVAYGRPSPAVIADMVACVHKYEAAVEDAKLEYSWLVDKFPQSTAVILSYAQFTDTVLNDIKAAKILRMKAALMEDEDLQDVPEEGAEKIPMDGGSTVSSDNDARSSITQFMLSWRNDISGAEYRNLSALQMRVQITLILILAGSTVGFVLLDSVLFSDQANVNMQLIDASDLFRGLTVSAAFWLRSEMMAAHAGDAADYLANQGKNDRGMSKMRTDHADNFKYLQGGPVEQFYFTERLVSTPSVSGWHHEEIDYWSFGNDFSRRGRLAAATSMAELQDPNYSLADISMEKRCIYYVQETAFREAIPFFFDVVTKYDENVRAFGDTATMVVSLNVVVNALLVLLLSYMTLTTVQVLNTVQFQVVACRLALALPRQTAKKIWKFYDAEHHALSDIGDEQAQQDDILNGDGGALTFKELESGNGFKAIGHGKDEGADSEDDTALELVPRITSIEFETLKTPRSERASIQRVPHVASAGSSPPEMAGVRAGVMAGNSFTSNLAAEHFRLSPGEDKLLSPMSRESSAAKGLKSALKTKNASPHPGTLSLSAFPLTPDALVTLQRQLSDDAPEKGNTPSGSVGLRHYLKQEYESHSVKDILSAINSSPNTGAPRKKKDGLLPAITRTDNLTSSMGFADAATTAAGKVLVTNAAGKESEEEEESEEEDEEEESEEEESAGSQDLSEGSGESAGEGSPGVTVSGARFGVEEHVFPGAPTPVLDMQKKSSLKRVSVEHDRAVKIENGTAATDGEGSERPDDAHKVVEASFPDELREMDPEVGVDILKSVESLHKIHNRASTYVVVLLLTLIMCICSITIPSRFIGQMVNLGPTSNNAAFRRTLVESCAHLARELVLNDGFSRMTQGEIAGTLHGTLRRLRESDQAVRRGGSLNVAQGADFWSPAHNHVMYDEGCPWHADGNCSTVDYPSAGAGGVYALALQFQESVESILEMYGGPREEWKDTFGEQRSEGDLATVTYKTVTYNPERAKLLKSSKPVHFVLGGFDGSLFKGYTLVLDVLKKEMNSILQKVHFELRMMYGLYVALLLFGFYAVLFRPTIAGSYWHTERARNFVQMLPTHTLAFAEVQLLKDHFVISQDDL